MLSLVSHTLIFLPFSTALRWTRPRQRICGRLDGRAVRDAYERVKLRCRGTAAHHRALRLVRGISSPKLIPSRASISGVPCFFYSLAFDFYSQSLIPTPFYYIGVHPPLEWRIESYVLRSPNLKLSFHEAPTRSFFYSFTLVSSLRSARLSCERRPDPGPQVVKRLLPQRAKKGRAMLGMTDAMLCSGWYLLDGGIGVVIHDVRAFLVPLSAAVYGVRLDTYIRSVTALR